MGIRLGGVGDFLKRNKKKVAAVIAAVATAIAAGSDAGQAAIEGIIALLQ